MSCYIVSIQAKLEGTLTKARERLKTFGGYCPINHTCWAVTTDKKASEVRDIVAEALSQGDRIFVIRSGTEAAWKNAYGDQHSEWLKKNL